MGDVTPDRNGLPVPRFGITRAGQNDPRIATTWGALRLPDATLSTPPYRRDRPAVTVDRKHVNIEIDIRYKF